MTFFLFLSNSARETAARTRRSTLSEPQRGALPQPAARSRNAPEELGGSELWRSRSRERVEPGGLRRSADGAADNRAPQRRRFYSLIPRNGVHSSPSCLRLIRAAGAPAISPRNLSTDINNNKAELTQSHRATVTAANSDPDSSHISEQQQPPHRTAAFQDSGNERERKKKTQRNNSHSVSGNEQAALHHHIGQKIQIVG